MSTVVTGRVVIAVLLAPGCCACASFGGASTLVGGLRTPAAEPAGRQLGAAAGDQEEPQIQADRPDLTNATYTVPKGLVQLESGVQHWRVVAGESMATPVSLRVGLAHWFEARIDTDGLTRDRQPPQTSTEFGGLTVGGKFRLWAPAGGAPVVAVQPALTIPWGRPGGGTDYALRVISGSDLPAHLHLDVNYIFGAIASGDSHFVQHFASASANISIGRHWNPYVEAYWVSRLAPDVGRAQFIDAGAIYTLNERMALDGGVAFGLTGATNGPSVFAGLSIIVAGIAGHRDVHAQLRDAYLRGDR